MSALSPNPSRVKPLRQSTTEKQRRLIRELEQELGRQPSPIPGSRRKAATRIDSLLAEKRRWAARSDRRRRRARRDRVAHRDRERTERRGDPSVKRPITSDWPAREHTREWALELGGPELWEAIEDAMRKQRPA